jgi:hypothetical protein
VEGPYEHINKPSGSIKCWEIPEAASQELSSIELIMCVFYLIFVYLTTLVDQTV